MFWLFLLFLCFEFKLNTSGQGYWGKRLRLWQTAPRLRCRSCGRCFFLFHLLGLSKQKTKHSKTTPTTPTATLLSCLSLHPSSCIPCSKKFNEQEQTLKSKTATLLEIFIHSSHLRCPSARSKMSSMLSTIRLKFFRSSRGFSTSLAGNLLFCRLRRVRTQNWEILRSKLFASIEAFFSVWASESGTMQRCVHHKMLYT